MLRKIKNCPLVAITRNGNIFLFNYDVTVKTSVLFTYELTTQSIAEVSVALYKQGIDIVNVTIDEARMKYIEIEVL